MRIHRHHQKRKRGFTLIETLVVVGIIPLLAGVFVASVSDSRDKAQDSATKQEMNTVRVDGEIAYLTNNGSYEDFCTGDVPTQISEDDPNFVCNDSPGAYAAETTLTDGTFYCVDYTGQAGEAPVSTISSNDFLCNPGSNDESNDDPSSEISGAADTNEEYDLCSDNIDNDLDGDTDCDDTDCGGLLPCLFEVCDDGSDNDEDSYVDCYDWDCNGSSACTVEQNCVDGVDDDFDGDIDCDDTDCDGENGCDGDSNGGGETESVDSESIVNCAITFSGTCYSVNRYIYTISIDDANNNGNPEDLTDAFICDGSSSYSITRTVPAGYSEYVEYLDLYNDTNDNYVVQSFTDLSGAITCSLTSDENGLCDDNIDNDGDGDQDCADSDCSDDGEYGPNGGVCYGGAEEVCGDGYCDGLIDTVQSCPADCGLGYDYEYGTDSDSGDQNTVETRCSDGIDGDGDGDFDCSDSDCSGTAVCTSVLDRNSFTLTYDDNAIDYSFEDNNTNELARIFTRVTSEFSGETADYYVNALGDFPLPANFQSEWQAAFEEIFPNATVTVDTSTYGEIDVTLGGNIQVSGDGGTGTFYFIRRQYLNSEVFSF